MCTLFEKLQLPPDIENLQGFKERYRKAINSERTFDKIKSLEELVTVLERRDELGDDNKESIEVFLDRLKQMNPTISVPPCCMENQYTTGSPPCLAEQLAASSTSQFSSVPCNRAREEAKCEKVSVPPCRMENQYATGSPPCPADQLAASITSQFSSVPCNRANEEATYEKVLEYIGARLKRSWRMLGTKLEMKHGDMDEIASDNRFSREEGKQMLKLWFKQRNSTNLHLLMHDLASALENIGEEELRDYVYDHMF